MATFTVNGKTVTADKNQKLLRYLRDELRLTSVKDGCSEGACGTCTIIIDGKAVKSCVQQTDRLEGKTILTVEGLSDFEKEAYVRAFGEAGAVQCGFCTPGMVMSAKALLDIDPDPSEEAIRKALRGNVCRCTGYVKIVDAVRLAGKYLREGKLPPENENWTVGSRVPRLDVREKVLGYGEFTDDMYVEGMLYGSAVRAKYARARVLAIHTEKAKALPGVAAVYTAADIPRDVKVGHLKKDWDTMIPVGRLTHYLGDAIALVVAQTPEILEQAKALVEVEYEPLPPVRSAADARAENAPLVHEHEKSNLLAKRQVKRGDVEAAFARSARVFHGFYKTPFTEHAFLEPECAVALPDGDGVLVYSSDQSVYDTQHEIAPMLGLPLEKVKVQNKLVGGGFGGKEDVSVQHHAALIAYLLKRPVKVKLTRQESMLIHPKRHPMEMDFTVGVDEKGTILGVRARIHADTGAYASLGGPVLERACTHAGGPYNFQNFDIEGYAWYTNNPPAGAFRGFGVTQSCFAMESMLNRIAHEMGISPWEIRFRNAIRPGQEMPNGQVADASTGLVETLLALREEYENAKYAGIACAMKNAGVGVGLPDTGRVRLEVKDGKVFIHAGASCIGQGLGTVLVQYVHQATGIPRESIVYAPATTFRAPDSGTTSGSRQTLVTGEAALRACVKLREDYERNTLRDLEGREYYGEYLAATDPPGCGKANPISHVAYGYATHVAILSEDGRLERVIAAHEVGRAVNPLSIEGQIEGGVTMSCGYALTEKFPIDENCRPTAKFGTLGLFRADNVPGVTSVIVEKAGVDKAMGAIGIGEITSIPTAPAIAEAYYRFDGRERTTLPLEDTPYSK
ncbi:MAG TPA: selenium-dependent xanthine dehydrogenase [Clostridia bacterium]|nr:selenium-dependent xanthine dehydrogenase [Clostridia bacterium]